MGLSQRGWRLATAGVVALAAGSCATPRPSAPDGPPVVAVRMHDHRFDMAPSVPSGRVVFEVTNHGTADHDLTLASIPADAPALDPGAASGQGLVLSPLALVSTRKPGQRGTFAADLAPGRYRVICFVTDADGTSHARKGMQAEFRAVE